MAPFRFGGLTGFLRTGLSESYMCNKLEIRGQYWTQHAERCTYQDVSAVEPPKAQVMSPGS